MIIIGFCFVFREVVKPFENSDENDGNELSSPTQLQEQPPRPHGGRLIVRHIVPEGLVEWGLVGRQCYVRGMANKYPAKSPQPQPAPQQQRWRLPAPNLRRSDFHHDDCYKRHVTNPVQDDVRWYHQFIASVRVVSTPHLHIRCPAGLFSVPLGHAIWPFPLPPGILTTLILAYTVLNTYTAILQLWRPLQSNTSDKRKWVKDNSITVHYISPPHLYQHPHGNDFMSFWWGLTSEMSIVSLNRRHEWPWTRPVTPAPTRRTTPTTPLTTETLSSQTR